MIEIRYLQAESGANKFGTCNCCGKSSGEDPLMISVKFSYYGHGTSICLCDDCKKKLMEALPPAQPEIVRCKDCKYWNSGSCEYPEHAVNCQDYWVGDIETEAEHFCGYAKRREVTV